MNTTQSLQLATGSHEAGSGKGCAMNVVSWENGDVEITDFPSCSDPMLSRIVQRVNDEICDHTDNGLLCPPCSTLVLDLGHRTVGSGEPLGLSLQDRYPLWVRVAAHMARQAAHLSDDLEALTAINAVEDWLDGTVTFQEVQHLSTSDLTPAAFAFSSVYFAAKTAYNAAAQSASYACIAPSGVQYSDLFSCASAAIDKFWDLVQSQPSPIDPELIQQALYNMAKVDL